MKHLFSEIRHFFSQNKIQKQKKEPRQLPKGKKAKNNKGARVLVWIIIFLIAVAGPLAFVRSNHAQDRAREAKAQVQQAKGAQAQQSHNQAYNSPKFQIYADRVVDAYINIPRGDDDRKGWEDTLKDYVVSKDLLPDVDFNGYRQLNDKTYYGKKKEGHHVVARYKVDYDTILIKKHEEKVKKGKKKKTKTVEDEDKKDHTAILNIPIRADKNNRFAVVESMYFTNPPELASGHQKKVSNPYAEDERSEVHSDERESIRDWLERFFSDYASKSKEDMAYMMDDPESLNGLQKFKEISHFKAYKKGGSYIAKVDVTYQDPDADIEHQEAYTLHLEKKNGKYYVKTFNQTKGGK